MMQLLLGELYLWCAGATILAVIIKIALITLFVFSIIGIISTIRFFSKRKKPKMDPGEEWLKTGKF